MARTFKTATLGGGFGALAWNADTLRGFANANPELLAQMGGVKGLENYIKQHQQATFHNSESGGEYQFSPETRAIDELLNGYQMNSVGAAGMEDGRRKEIVKDGQSLYQGEAYSYKPAQENLETLMRGGALLGGAYAAFNPGGFLAGMSSAPPAAPSMAGASVADGGWLLGSAFADVAAGAGTLAPEGVAALIPTGAQLGAAGGGSLLAGGMLGGGIGSAAGAIPGMDMMKKAGGGLLDFAKGNPKAAGAILGGLFGGAGGGSSGGAPAYTGPMPTIERGNWSPTAKAQMMAVPQFGGQMQKTGNANSGLWRYGQ